MNEQGLRQAEKRRAYQVIYEMASPVERVVMEDVASIEHVELALAALSAYTEEGWERFPMTFDKALDLFVTEREDVWRLIGRIAERFNMGPVYFFIDEVIESVDDLVKSMVGHAMEEACEIVGNSLGMAFIRTDALSPQNPYTTESHADLQAPVQEAPDEQELIRELQKTVEELRQQIADIRHEQHWDLDDEEGDDENGDLELPPETYECSVCGSALMRNGDALDMADRQVATDEEGVVYCPSCYRDVQMNRKVVAWKAARRLEACGE